MAEVRSYVFDEVKRKGQGIKFHFVSATGIIEETMTIPYEELDRGFVTARGIKSKFNPSQTFDLVSFKWEDDKDRLKRESKNKQMNVFDILYPEK